MSSAFAGSACCFEVSSALVASGSCFGCSDSSVEPTGSSAEVCLLCWGSGLSATSSGLVLPSVSTGSVEGSIPEVSAAGVAAGALSASATSVIGFWSSSWTVSVGVGLLSSGLSAASGSVASSVVSPLGSVAFSSGSLSVFCSGSISSFEASSCEALSSAGGVSGSA